MNIDLDKKLISLKGTWHDFVYSRHSKHAADIITRDNFISIYGPRGSGKTAFAQRFVETYKNAHYFSFEYSNNESALRLFGKTFFPKLDSPVSWEDAAKKFILTFKGQYILLIIDDIDEFENEDVFMKSFVNEIYYSKERIAVAVITSTDRDNFRSIVKINYMSIADFCKLIPNYSNADTVRLYALSGGIPTITKELDSAIGFKENLNKLFRFDSAFCSYLPARLSEDFRSPESYLPILNSIANGNHRLSKIASDIGFANNKCDTYLKALTEKGYVEARIIPESRYKSYFLKNSYYTAWCLYARLNPSLQYKTVEKFTDLVLESLDDKLAVPAYHEACYMFMASENNFRFAEKYEIKPENLKKPITVRFKDKTKVIIGYCAEFGDSSLVGVFADDLYKKYTAEDIKIIRKAVYHYFSPYDTEIVVFSPNRFSDSCVHESSINENFRAITAERLKYWGNG